MLNRAYLSVLASAVCCYAALAVVLRDIPTYIGGSVAIGVAVGAPAITAVVTRPLGGRLADGRGPRLVMVAGACVMAAGAPLMLADGYPAFIASRLVVGAGEGAMMSAGSLWLLRLAGPERRGRAIGHIGVANFAGLALGPLLADALGLSHPHRIFLAAAVLPLLGLVALPRRAPDAVKEERARRGFGEIALLIVRPGVGLLLVNIGYAALIGFGTESLGGASVAVLPVYAATVIAVRVFLGWVPDRVGPLRTLTFACATASAGLLMAGFLPVALALVGLVLLGIGQALAVPSLGILALESVPAEQHGIASGVFFSWFDAGVGLGGPISGGAAALAGDDGALVAGAIAVALARVAVMRRR